MVCGKTVSMVCGNFQKLYFPTPQFEQFVRFVDCPARIAWLMELFANGLKDSVLPRLSLPLPPNRHRRRRCSHTRPLTRAASGAVDVRTRAPSPFRRHSHYPERWSRICFPHSPSKKNDPKLVPGSSEKNDPFVYAVSTPLCPPWIQSWVGYSLAHALAFQH